jgi:hypothetical protein
MHSYLHKNFILLKKWALQFFMVNLRIKDEFLSPFLKNMMMDLSSTSGMMFLLL